MPNVDLALVERLEDKAIEIRKQLFDLTFRIGSSHLGGALSMADFTVALYYHFLKVDPKNPNWPERDRFVLSKGHAGCLLYNILSDMGFFQREELLTGYNVINGRFGQHPNRKYIPGIEASTGSLGHGLSLALGMALAGRMNKENHRVVCVTGDGELNEGTNWEAIMAAGKYQLGNLVWIVDKNYIQCLGTTDEVMPLEPLDDKIRAFNWEVRDIGDGNDMEQVVEALSALPASDSQTRRKPVCLIAHTVKGKGVPFMENLAAWHQGGLDDEKCAECCEIVERQRKVRR